MYNLEVSNNLPRGRARRKRNKEMKEMKQEWEEAEKLSKIKAAVLLKLPFIMSWYLLAKN